MKWESRRVFACVQEDNGAKFAQEINKILRANRNAKITYPPTPPFTAYIEYSEDVNVPESIADEYELAGCKHYCIECPHLENTGDKRRKRFRCRYAANGITRVDMGCCDRFYEDLEAGVFNGEQKVV